MEADQMGSAGAGLKSHPGRGEPASELDGLRARCRRQAMVIDDLTGALATVTGGVKALKAENAELREELARLHGRRSVPTRAQERLDGAELAEVAIPLGTDAPRVARDVVVRCLVDRVRLSVLEDARLLVSELVTNSVCRSPAGEQDQLVLRIHLWRDTCRVEVEDPECDGVIAPLTPDDADGSEIRLNLVQLLSERWGIVRAEGRPTRVWAQLSGAAASG